MTANYVGNNTSHIVAVDELNPAQFLGLGACSINGVNYATCSTTANTNQRRRLALQNPAQGQFFSTVSTLDDVRLDGEFGIQQGIAANQDLGQLQVVIGLSQITGDKIDLVALPASSLPHEAFID